MVKCFICPHSWVEEGTVPLYGRGSFLFSPVCGNAPGRRIPPMTRSARLKSGTTVLLLDNTSSVYLEVACAPVFVIFCTSNLSKMQVWHTFLQLLVTFKIISRLLGMVELTPQDPAPHFLSRGNSHPVLILYPEAGFSPSLLPLPGEPFPFSLTHSASSLKIRCRWHFLLATLCAVSPYDHPRCEWSVFPESAAPRTHHSPNTRHKADRCSFMYTSPPEGWTSADRRLCSAFPVLNI